MLTIITANCNLNPKTVNDAAGDYKIVWSDEFDTPGLPDSTKWNYDVGGHGWGNDELQTYTNKRLENAHIENGLLIIKANREPMNGMNYTSARLISKYKGDWLYGRVEVRAQLPKGRGTWPAIWMLPAKNVYGQWPKSGEIDIMEHVGYDPGKIHQTIHTEAYNHAIKTQRSSVQIIPDVQDTFHIYSIEWSDEKIVFFIDNKPHFIFDNEHKDHKTWPFDQPFYLLLNIAVGGKWGGSMGVDERIWPQQMQVDYVRVFQRK
jgi:beta-glucanase (GH16 family)